MTAVDGSWLSGCLSSRGREYSDPRTPGAASRLYRKTLLDDTSIPVLVQEIDCLFPRCAPDVDGRVTSPRTHGRGVSSTCTLWTVAGHKNVRFMWTCWASGISVALHDGTEEVHAPVRTGAVDVEMSFVSAHGGNDVDDRPNRELVMRPNRGRCFIVIGVGSAAALYHQHYDESETDGQTNKCPGS